MAAPEANVRKVVADHQGDGSFLIMEEDGGVAWRASATAVVSIIRNQDSKYTKRHDISRITVIEWRNVPTDFIGPEVIK